ncbi:MAG: hypothetical protein ACWA5X_00585 [bacterium]
MTYQAKEQGLTTKAATQRFINNRQAIVPPFTPSRQTGKKKTVSWKLYLLLANKL